MADLTDLQQRRIRQVRNYSRFCRSVVSQTVILFLRGLHPCVSISGSWDFPIRTTIKLIYNGRLSRYLDDGSLSRYIDRAIRMYAQQLNKSFKVGGLLMSKAFNALRLNRNMPLMSKVFNALRLNRKEALQAEVDALHEERQFGWSVYFGFLRDSLRRPRSTDGAGGYAFASWKATQTARRPIRLAC